MRASLSEASCLAMMRVREECNGCIRKTGRANPPMKMNFKGPKRPRKEENPCRTHSKVNAERAPRKTSAMTGTLSKGRSTESMMCTQRKRGILDRDRSSSTATISPKTPLNSSKRVGAEIEGRATGKDAPRLCPNCKFPLSSNSRFCGICQPIRTQYKEDPAKMVEKLEEAKYRRENGLVRKGKGFKRGPGRPPGFTRQGENRRGWPAGVGRVCETAIA